MEKPNLSPDFTIDDIHKIRGYNYEKTKHMTTQEARQYYDSQLAVVANEFPHIKAVLERGRKNLKIAQ